MKKLFTLFFATLASISVMATEGALPGRFTINANGAQVQFSQGNLQATTTDLGGHWSWSFAEHQWSKVGNVAANTAITGNGTVSTNGTVDLFCWSSTGTYFGIHNSTNSDDYSGDFVDWGTLIGEGWRTLSKDEWDYLLKSRDKPNDLRACATVNGARGYIILPDNWTTPSGLSFDAGWINWDTNTYTTEQWAQMEAAGAVFLPAAGQRYGTEVSDISAYGKYWTTRLYGSGGANYLYTAEHDGYCSGGLINYGHSVRLVYQSLEKYDLRICGTQITSANCNNIASAVEGVTGTVSYNPGTKTLTLTNATLTTSDMTQAIWNTGIDGLKIDVNGTCDLNTPYCIALRSDANTTIEGTSPTNDILKVRNAGPFDQEVGGWPEGSAFTALATFADASLTINNCFVEVEGAIGIQLQGNTQLTVNHAKLTAQSIGTSFRPAHQENMRSFKANVEPILNNSTLTAPTGITFSSTLGGYTTDGTNLTREKVIIEPNTSTAIHPVNSDNILCAKILRNGQLFIIRDGRMYTVQGQEIK